MAVDSKYIYISRDTTLRDLGEIVGTRNLDAVLNLNMLPRVPNIGEVYYDTCIQNAGMLENVTYLQKKAILDTCTDNFEVFQYACTQDEFGWKVLSAINSFPNTLRIPENVVLSDFAEVLGGQHDSKVSKDIYDKTISQLMTGSHAIDPSIFNNYSNIRTSQINRGYDEAYERKISKSNNAIFQYFPIPYTQISLHSSLSNTYVNIPVYPEEVSDGFAAEYSQMQELLYQYEPWQVYTSSGPRSNTYKFTFHRDMWGDHSDGEANKIVRFCQANCYPRYSGSAVHSAIVTLYINGKVVISGILTKVDVNWSGPLGQHDNWYLLCELMITITEVSQEPLNFDSVQTKGIIG